MNNHISIYRFTAEQVSLLTAHMPEGYFFRKAADVIELIEAEGICNLICSERMDAKSRRFLDIVSIDHHIP